MQLADGQRRRPRSDKQIRLDPEKSVLGLGVGDPIELNEPQFRRLSNAFLAEIETGIRERRGGRGWRQADRPDRPRVVRADPPAGETAAREGRVAGTS